MKGIILAGGSGTRLYPVTKVTSKQLLPIYDKPMIYYSLSILMLADIKDILIISTPYDILRFKELLGNGNNFGINLTYKVQEKPNGLAEAFILGEDFISDNPTAMILGDNIFYGAGLRKHLLNSVERATKDNIATVFSYFVKDPERYGIVELDDKNNPVSIVEKPKNPKSNYALTGLYFYPKGVSKFAKQITPSDRGELEITSLNNIYLKNKNLHVSILGRGYTWLDTGTFDSLLDASDFVKCIEEHQGIKICCPEEVAYINGWISKEKIMQLAKEYNNSYGKHLINVCNGSIKY